ncbi:hypothetical protein RRG08_013140 [Elysia crispata]|uniref:Uncharacterized protein n=1 Tax=Elysia crispata TaxID=231223 RepID=A0AAE1DQ16_9GAST|nr:hypothetical protein RRG08_013140 [Elysia crispata]
MHCKYNIQDVNDALIALRHRPQPVQNCSTAVVRVVDPSSAVLWVINSVTGRGDGLRTDTWKQRGEKMGGVGGGVRDQLRNVRNVH